jgi:hypothetical protein
VTPVIRLVLLVWLAIFAAQSSDLLAIALPDECTESSQAGDPCQDNCVRCVCCARLPVFVSQPLATVVAEPADAALLVPAVDTLTDAIPRAILHVPKIR